MECPSCGALVGRDAMQTRLQSANPGWRDIVARATQQLSSESAPFAPSLSEPHAVLKEGGKGSGELQRPDGDVELGEVDYSGLTLPECESCGGFLKPGATRPDPTPRSPPRPPSALLR